MLHIFLLNQQIISLKLIKINGDVQNLSSIELEDILSKGGVSDINFKKQMLINKIRN